MSDVRNERDLPDADYTGEIDVRGIGRVIARRKRLVIIPTVVAFVAALAYVNIVKPRYTGEAQVLIENQENYFTRPDSTAQATDTAPDAEAVTSQVQLVTSRDLARDAIKKLGLKGSPEFDPAAGGVGPLSRVLILLGIRRAPTDESVEDRILESYYDRLSVNEVSKSRVLSIDFSSQDPDLAAKGANTIADLYIGLQADAKRDRARVAAQSLATQIADLKGKVADAQNQAASFRASSGLLLGNNNTTIASQQLADITTQLATARTAEADAQAKAQLIRDMLRQGRLNDVSDVANNELIRQIAAQRVNLSAQLALESRTYLPGHPRIKELSAQLSDLDNALRSAAEQTARSLENDAKVAGSRVANLQTALDQQKQKVGDSSADETKLQELDGNAQVLKAQLDATTAKYQEALARQNAGSTPGDARVISRAIAPILPSFPKKVPLTLFATLAALVLSVAYVVSSELLSGRAYQPAAPTDSVEDETPLAPQAMPAAVAVAAPPVMAVEPSSFQAKKPIEAEPTAIEAIASKLGEQPQADYAIRILTAAGSASAPILATARSLGRGLAHNHRVVLVELGRSDPAEAARSGLSDLIGGQASFADVIHRDRGSRLHIISAGLGEIEPSEDLDLTLEALSQTYDHVVLAAPGGDTNLVRALGPEADFVVLVETDEAEDGAIRDSLVRHGAGEIFVVDADGDHMISREAAKTAA
ncbi:MAG TPA: exopolysaccharide transport family protein [Beijerinckiaceae bacterium]|nr:exopolysaccharide transport family protein [Beijerinckiaceae bacterium]